MFPNSTLRGYCGDYGKVNFINFICIMVMKENKMEWKNIFNEIESNFKASQISPYELWYFSVIVRVCKSLK